jgi:outer membrane protein
MTLSSRLREKIAAATVALVMTVGVVPATAQSLADTLVAAYTNSGLLDQNRAVLRAADENVASAIATLRPVIGYVASSTYRDPQLLGTDRITNNAALTFSWLLTDFGRSRIAVDLQKELVLATREGLLNVEQQVLLRAVNAYAGVLSNIALVDLAENNVDVLGEQLRADSDRFEVGEVTRTDVSLTESRLAASRAQLAAARGAFERAREEYAAATGIQATNLQSPPTPPVIPSTPEQALAIARQRAPLLRQAQRQVTASEIGIELAEAALRPRLDLRAQALVNNDFDSSSSIGLELSGPIYQGGQISSAIRSARADRDAARGALIESQFLVEQTVANAYVNLNVANASIAAVDAQIQASALALEGAREEQQLGARTTLDVLIVEQDFLDARTDRVTALTDRFVAIFQILASAGLLTVENLGLNVPQYDPAAYYNAVRGAPTTIVSPQGEQLDRVLNSIGRN